MAASMTRMSRSSMSRMTGVRAWVRPMPMWWSRPLSRRVTVAGRVDAVVADAVVGVGRVPVGVALGRAW